MPAPGYDRSRRRFMHANPLLNGLFLAGKNLFKLLSSTAHP